MERRKKLLCVSLGFMVHFAWGNHSFISCAVALCGRVLCLNGNVFQRMPLQSLYMTMRLMHYRSIPSHSRGLLSQQGSSGDFWRLVMTFVLNQCRISWVTQTVISYCTQHVGWKHERAHIGGAFKSSTWPPLLLPGSLQGMMHWNHWQIGNDCFSGAQKSEAASLQLMDRGLLLGKRGLGQHAHVRFQQIVAEHVCLTWKMSKEWQHNRHDLYTSYRGHDGVMLLGNMIAWPLAAAHK